jgi:putative ABC transport system permease protein
VTLLDERPDTESAPSGAWAGPPRTWSTASWRLAARLARREVRRRPGRTLLVALLVAIPVFAMAFGSITVRSGGDHVAYARSYGASDFAIEQYNYIDEGGASPAPVTGADLPAGTLPEGTESTDVLTTYSSVTASTGEPFDIAAMHIDVDSPIVDGIVDVTSGRLPADGTDEVLLHPRLATELGVGVGDTLTLARPDRTLSVVGLGRTAADHGRRVMLFGELDRDSMRSWTFTTLVDLPPGATAGEALTSIATSGVVSADRIQGLSARTPDGYWYAYAEGFQVGDDRSTSSLAWGWVAGVLSLAALGVIIAAAFATSARRQLATVGQLAANGASPGLIRRTLSLQGTWSGAVGAIVGIGAAIVFFLVGTPLVERVANHSWTNTTIAPIDMVVLFATGVAAATIAALLPARSLANTSVLSALAGRRPIRPVQARTVTAGVICFVSGLFLLAVAAAATNGSDGSDGNLFALVAILGGLGVLAGMCLASPLAVTAATNITSRLGASWRLSGRSMYRTRWRSAAVVTAIGVAGAFAVAGASVVSSVDTGDQGPTDLPRNVVLLRTSDGTNASSLDPEVLRVVRSVVGSSAESMLYGVDVAPPTDEQLNAAYPNEADPDFDPTVAYFNVVNPYELTIADDTLLDGMGLSSADRANLDEYGAVSLWAAYVWDDTGTAVEAPTITSMLITGDGNIEFDAAGIVEPYTSRNGANGYVMTEARAGELGVGVIPTGIRFTADSAITASQRRALDEIRFGTDQFSDVWIVGDEAADYPDDSGRQFWIDYQWVNWNPSSTLVQAAIVAAALLLVLLVVAIGLSLAAVESRDERNTLIAVGASPSTLRRRSATTATVLAATGGVIAIPTGLLPIWVVTRATDGTATVPWLSIVAIVVAIPVLVGAIAFVGSAVIQRVRPPKVMQAFTD